MAEATEDGYYLEPTMIVAAIKRYACVEEILAVLAVITLLRAMMSAEADDAICTLASSAVIYGSPSGYRWAAVGVC